jgi:hypothetical protein
MSNANASAAVDSPHVPCSTSSENEKTPLALSAADGNSNASRAPGPAARNAMIRATSQGTTTSPQPDSAIACIFSLWIDRRWTNARRTAARKR